MDGYAAFPARASTLEAFLTSGELQSSNGGWPHKLDIKSAATTIVSTAHVVEMLRIWDHEYDSETVQSALAFLAREVIEQTQPVKTTGSGRGEWTRFPVFALWGLTRFHRAIFDPEFEDGLAIAIKWLARNELPGGGWGVHKSAHELSFTMTTPAVHALDRLRQHHRLATERRISRDALVPPSKHEHTWLRRSAKLGGPPTTTMQIPAPPEQSWRYLP